MTEDGSSSRSWFQSLRSLTFWRREASLRDQIEDAIEEAEEDGERPAPGDLSAIEREMLKNLLHFGERTVGDIAVPRSDIIAVPTTTSFAELVKAFAEAGHSRLPVYKDNLDDVVGMVHIKDVFGILARNRKPPATITRLIRQPLYVPAARGVLDLLADMRAKRMHLAIVIDEYSGTEGLVTIEDLVEEIVGDIEDEHDDAPVAMLANVEDGIWEADARAPLEDVAEMIDARLGDIDEDVDTLGGLAFVLAGHVPSVGEILAHDSGWQLEVTEGDERRVTRLRL
ncbi:MAG: hemolysin family protein, partial [Alphaproteobacteria bacterium]|nr:hemolysin family protein [Alphaproteobacteria bacterium]